MNGVVAENLALMYRDAAERYGDAPAFGTRVGKNEFSTISYAELYESGCCLSTALIELGLRARSHVALLSDNRVEWNIADYAVILAGAADVPRGTDVTNQEIEYIVNHSDAEIVFVESRKLLDRVISLMPALQNVKHLILMDAKQEAPEGVLQFYALIEEGKRLRQAGDKRVEERISGTQPSDLFTLIYTSGTTGTPKGVQLAHANMVSQVKYLPFPLSSDDRLLSILPVWHSYERVFEMIALSNGSCTYFTSIRTLGEDLRCVRPTMMASAPRLWENLYLKILKNVDGASPIKQALFKAAYFCSRMVKSGWFFIQGKKLDMTGRPALLSLALGIGYGLRVLVFLLPYVLLNAIVLKNLRAIVGGEFKGTVSGGGALQPHVDEFFNYIGVPVQEGYGLTETSPVIAVRTEKKLVIGTVGPLYEETELRIVDINTQEILYPNTKYSGDGRGLKGEIHVKGPQVMQGYYKNDEATERVLQDGWINTGDVGAYTFNDCLKIMGRSKDTIVLLNGENIEPIPIEAKLCESALIDQCMVVGQDQKCLSALVVPSLEGFAAAGIGAETVVDLSANEENARAVSAEVKRLVNADHGFKAFEQIQDIRLLPKPFEIGDEMTNTFKVKRHVVDEKYAELVASMY